MLNRVFHLIVKELLATLRDPKARMVLIVPPLIQIFILSFAITQDVKNVAFGVLNLDAGAEGYALVQCFAHSPTFTQIVTLTHHGEIAAMIDRQQVMGVLVVPQDFSQNTLAGRTADLQVLLDGRKTNAAPIVSGYATRIIQQFYLDRRGGEVAAQGVHVATRHRYNENLVPQKTTVPGLICVLATILGMAIAALSIARERETGTFEQLLVSPLTPFEILLGKAVPTVILSTCSALSLVVVAIFFFGIPLQGSLWLLTSSMVLFLLSVVGVGLFVSSLAMTQQQAILGVMLVMPAAIMLSGFATPVENMPQWLQDATIMNPVRWYLIIVKGVFLKGMGLHDVLLNIIPLAAISVVTLTAAGIMFKRRME